MNVPPLPLPRPVVEMQSTWLTPSYIVGLTQRQCQDKLDA